MGAECVESSAMAGVTDEGKHMVSASHVHMC